MLEHGTFSARVDLQRRGRRLKHGTLHYAIPAAGWKMPATGIFVLLLLLLPGALYAANNADCLACHADKTKGLKGSVHAAASPGACLSCHGSAHTIFPKNDPRSAVYPLNIPNTCGTCHGGVEDQYLGGAHGKAVASGNMKAPVCTDCHTAHAILQPTLAAFRMQSTPICGSCHQGRFATYGDTFHSQLGLLGGSVQTARCWDCHGAHEILSASDPRSPVAPGNIVLSHPSYARAPPRIPMIRENAPGEIRRVLQQL
ncbi:MAG: cytochrome c3 family protein [Acidobacteriaceae bacterium]